MVYSRVMVLTSEVTVTLAVALFGLDVSSPVCGREIDPTSPQTIVMSEEELFDRIYGGWVGMLIGGLEGLPHEFKYLDEPRPELPEFTFLANGARSDDDNDIEWLHLWFMHQKKTLKIPYEEVVTIWKANMNKGIWRANKRARELMDEGLMPPLTGDVQHNEHAWYNLAGQFCVESYGLIAPGMPETAADVGLHYARISVSQEPLQAVQFWTTLVSRSFVSSEPIPALLEDSLIAVDPRSDMAQAVWDALNAYRKFPDDWKKARTAIHQEWRERRGWNDNSVTLNGAAVCLALLYGDGDFYQTLRYAMAIGYDADCNAATAGTVIGVRWGFRRISEHPRFQMSDRYVNHTRPELPQEIRVSDQARILFELAQQVILSQGGGIIRENDRVLYRIALQKPKLLELLPENVKRP